MLDNRKEDWNEGDSNERQEKFWKSKEEVDQKKYETKQITKRFRLMEEKRGMEECAIKNIFEKCIKQNKFGGMMSRVGNQRNVKQRNYGKILASKGEIGMKEKNNKRCVKHI